MLQRVFGPAHDEAERPEGELHARDDQRVTALVGQPARPLQGRRVERTRGQTLGEDDGRAQRHVPRGLPDRLGRVDRRARHLAVSAEPREPRTFEEASTVEERHRQPAGVIGRLLDRPRRRVEIPQVPPDARQHEEERRARHRYPARARRHQRLHLREHARVRLERPPPQPHPREPSERAGGQLDPGVVDLRAPIERPLRHREYVALLGEEPVDRRRARTVVAAERPPDRLSPEELRVTRARLGEDLRRARLLDGELTHALEHAKARALSERGRSEERRVAEPSEDAERVAPDDRLRAGDLEVAHEGGEGAQHVLFLAREPLPGPLARRPKRPAPPTLRRRWSVEEHRAPFEELGGAEDVQGRRRDLQRQRDPVELADERAERRGDEPIFAQIAADHVLRPPEEELLRGRRQLAFLGQGERAEREDGLAVHLEARARRHQHVQLGARVEDGPHRLLPR